MVPYTANKTETQKRPTTATANKIAMKPQDYFAVCGFYASAGLVAVSFFPHLHRNRIRNRGRNRNRNNITENRKPHIGVWLTIL